MMKISEMTTAPTLGDSDLLELAQVDGSEESGYATKKTTILAIGNRVNNQQTYTSDLQTTSKTIIGAINELVQGGGGGGSDVEVTPIITEGTKIATISVDDVDVDLYAENPREVFNDMSEIKSVTGNPATLTCEEKTCAKSAIVTFAPKQSGTGDPSPTNIRPISGWDGLVLTRTGVNQWDEEWEVGGYDTATGQKNTATNRIRNKNLISVKPNTTYYFVNADQAFRVLFYLADGSYIDNTAYNANQHDVLIPSDCKFINFQLSGNYGTTYKNDISINYPATDTEYHAYNGETYTATFPSTVMGGSYDFVSGEGSSEWGHIAEYNGETLPAEWISDRDVYAEGTTPTTGAEVAYKLATPTEIELTPADVELNKGTNVVSTDGDGLSVDYTEIATLDDMKILINATVGSVLNTEY